MGESRLSPTASLREEWPRAGEVGGGVQRGNDRIPGNAARGYEPITESLKCNLDPRAALLFSEPFEGWNQGSQSMVVFSGCLINLEERERECVTRTWPALLQS